MLGINVEEWFVDFPGALGVFIISMLPISELRGAIQSIIDGEEFSKLGKVIG